MALKSYKLGSDEVRRNWRDVLDAVQSGESVMVLRAHKPIAVIIPFGHWETVKDRLELLDDSLDFRAALETYRREVAAGRVERDPIWDKVIAEEVAAGNLAPLEPNETGEREAA